ncbi:putative adenylosuccinate lyase [Rosa chinensis]|uniref:Putative adenylosuccinate lyase n=1 Tax=Rosa chinensis TaxID=74649 RepID=A0A2P6QDE1_ROSCH|nr:putative adenylosuccinate lyase [Rosa chinensis]
MLIFLGGLVLVARLRRERKEISSVAIMGKFSGAVGNYNTHLVAYPNINWPHIRHNYGRD